MLWNDLAIQGKYYALDHKVFRNRQIISGTGVQYKSYINGVDGIQHGTPVGRTTYFSASTTAV